MAHIVAIFAPDRLSEWPGLDMDAAMIELDRATLPPRHGTGGPPRRDHR